MTVSTLLRFFCSATHDSTTCLRTYYNGVFSGGGSVFGVKISKKYRYFSNFFGASVLDTEQVFSKCGAWSSFAFSISLAGHALCVGSCWGPGVGRAMVLSDLCPLENFRPSEMDNDWMCAMGTSL